MILGFKVIKESDQRINLREVSDTVVAGGLPDSSDHLGVIVPEGAEVKLLCPPCGMVEPGELMEHVSAIAVERPGLHVTAAAQTPVYSIRLVVTASAMGNVLYSVVRESTPTVVEIVVAFGESIKEII
jgi:hypothetical protein